MLLLVLVIAIIGFVVGLFFDSKKIFEEFGAITMFANCCIFVVVFLCILWHTDTIIDGRVMDKKIKMYQEENSKIESQIGVAVSSYMTFENKTLTSLKPETMIMLINNYPQLKSDILVNKQIDIYLKNNDKIKDLKEELIDVSSAKWWVYFGG